MPRLSFLSSLAIAVVILVCGTAAADDDLMTEKYEKILEEQGYVVKELIQTAPMYFKVNVETLDTVTLQCTAYYMDQVKASDIYRITPDDEEIVFMIPEGVITDVKCVKAEGNNK